MTLNEAKNLLVAGDLLHVYHLKDAGTSLRQVFLDCLSYAQGAEMDAMVDRCLGLQRRGAFSMWGSNLPPETDVEFRLRAENYAYILDNYSPPGNGFIPKVSIVEIDKTCYHSWKHYQGILEAYDFCEFCDEKRKK